MSTEFNLTFFFETNRKQTTNLYKPVSDVFEQTAVLVPKQQQKFFFCCPGMSKDIQGRDVCAPAHFSSQGSTRAKLGSNKSQSKGQETSSDFVVSFGSLEQKLELERRTVCLSGRVFLIVLLGFSPLLPTPGFSRCVA